VVRPDESQLLFCTKSERLMLPSRRET
jgi:hypothetical protein